jgi:phage-related holin
MKAIILKLLHQSYEFIIYSLTAGFIFSFFVPIKGFLLFTVAVVFADTITGIKAAKKEGQKISSKGLYRTTEKIVVYFVSILIFEGAKNTFSIPVPITYMVAMMIAATELFSIAENVKRITGVELGTLITRFFRR